MFVSGSTATNSEKFGMTSSFTVMAYLIFGFALGTFVCGLIEYFHKPEETSWIKPSYLFALSGIGFLIFVYVAWPILKEVFS